jgi:K+-transporting ATPase ATPase A chain
MAIAGSMLTKKASPPSLGTLATDTPIFVVLLIGVIVILGGLTFLPALSLGPIVEQLLLNKGIFF